MHDTNAPYLFEKEKRALSHGCIRTQEIERICKYLIENNSDTSIETAKAAYEAGVTVSLDENGVAAQAAAYLAGPAAFTGTLDQIYMQEWICLFKQGMEAWSLYRKTGIPTTHHIASSMAESGYTGHNTPPFRYPYPISESTLNAANSASSMGDVLDDFWGKQMWFDTRTGLK